MSESVEPAAEPNEPSGSVNTFEHKGFSITTRTDPKTLRDALKGHEDARRAKEQDARRAKGEEVPTEEEEVSDAARKLAKTRGKTEKQAARAEKPAEKPEEDEGEEAKKETAEEIEQAPKDGRKKLASERVAEATRAAAEMKRQNKQLMEQNQQLARRLDEVLERITPKAEQKQAAKSDGAPDPAEYQGREDEYLQALIRHEAQKVLESERESRQQEERRSRINDTIQGRRASFRERWAKLSETDPEVSSKIAPELADLVPHYELPDGTRPSIENFIATEIVMSDHGPEVALYLSDHPEEFQRLAALRTPRDVSREVAKLEVRLEGASTGTPPPRTSKASPPVKPVNGAPFVADADGLRPGESADDYIRRRNGAVRRRILGISR